MFSNLLTLVFFLSTTSWSGSSATSWCGLLFQSEHLCALDPTGSNIVGAVIGIEDEIVCQEECDQTDGCSFFMFISYPSRQSECLLLNECDTSGAIKCSDSLSDCSLVVTGPREPPIRDACCEEGYGWPLYPQGQLIDSMNGLYQDDCQSLCRNTKGCQCYCWSVAAATGDRYCSIYKDFGENPVYYKEYVLSGQVFPPRLACKSNTTSSQSVFK